MLFAVYFPHILWLSRGAGFICIFIMSFYTILFYFSGKIGWVNCSRAFKRCLLHTYGSMQNLYGAINILKCISFSLFTLERIKNFLGFI